MLIGWGGQVELNSLLRRWELTLANLKTERPAMRTVVTGVWRAALLASVFVVGHAGTADAQFWQSFQYRQAPPSRIDTPSRQENRPRKSSNRSASSSSKKDAPIRHPFGENLPKGPLQLMVSLNEQRAVLYSNGVRVADAKVSSGVPGHPTPTGVFSIIQKNRWHRSNIYSNAPMYYMHRLTWSGIALHEGHLPGYAASHGCIRMPTDFVSRLWNVSALGMRVVVTRPEVAPREFSHAKLFNPSVKPADNTRTSEAPAGLRSSLDTTTGQGIARVAQAEPVADQAPTASDAPTATTTPAATS